MTGFFSASEALSERPTIGFVPKCGACGLYKHCQSPKMRPYGNGRKKVLIIGEAPGKTEDEEDRPFIGTSGQRLRRTLENIGIDLDRDCVTTNSLICHPDQNRTPESVEIEFCHPNVSKLIDEYRPSVVITLGHAAVTSALIGFWFDDVDKMERWAGQCVPLPDFFLCPTFHPSYVLRMKNEVLDRMFEKHLARAFEISERPPKREVLSWDVDHIYDEKEVYETLRHIDEVGGYTAFDYETNCLKPETKDSRIYSCSVSNGEITIAYPWTERNAVSTGMYLRSKRTKKIGANIKFEERWTQNKFGHGVTGWVWDVVLAAHSVDNRPGTPNVKFQAFVKFGICSYNRRVEQFLSNDKSPINRIHEISMGDLLLYNALDSLSEYRLAIRQMKEVEWEM